ncbi:response regulator [Bacillus timonensis]|uniref:Response regulator n=1 Tax=Bacillus timonensis TaxID=1033734 RepID=A0A4S3PWL7_9BACI|nr:response regulator [Bacillus timonensis]THE13964.1 response regulator [Bacillus timonensis]
MEQLLKVLIADDEPNIRERIRYSIDWQKYGMEVTAEAEDGERALELAYKYEVDILLADLNMPIMNGLTLIKNIKEKLPACRVVIISGYDEFSYAQEALRLQVEDYILKPIKPNSLLEVLNKVRSSIQSHMAQTKYLEIASNHITHNTLILQEQFCREWVEGKLTKDEIVEQLQFWRLPKKVPQMMIVIRCRDLQMSQSLNLEMNHELRQWKLKNVILDMLPNRHSLIFSDPSGLVILLWEYVDEKMFTELDVDTQSELKISPTLYSETISGDFDSVPAVYQNCIRQISEESLISPIVRRAKEIIYQQYTNPGLTLEFVAHQLQVSTVYLSRLIKQELGTSFTGLVTELRIRRAIHLLNFTNLQVYEIAEQAGYESQHYFSTAFKKAVGVSPNQYRKGALQ